MIITVMIIIVLCLSHFHPRILDRPARHDYLVKMQLTFFISGELPIKKEGVFSIILQSHIDKFFGPSMLASYSGAFNSNPARVSSKVISTKRATTRNNCLTFKF